MEQISARVLNTSIEEFWMPILQDEHETMRKLQKECEEYAKLVFTCERLLGSQQHGIDIRFDLGQKIYVNAEIQDSSHVVVKLMDDLYAKMNLTSAVKYSKKKMEMALKPATVKSMLVVARRGNKRKIQINRDALTVFTALVNIFVKVFIFFVKSE
ncbi:unnamed protein product [Caenorhabditis bovis]|uniref:Uncharacterized protein n=1 Tax=Caenorhabditis bovis TaxID=2654633 RepID=A0A8S1F1N2_9PELO|nr:unnamed protein product [Caenorhabditis bovis]